MKNWNLEYKLNLPKKGLRWIHGHAKPEKLEDGSILWHGYINDITEQKKIELELINTQARLSLNNQINRTIIDTIPFRFSRSMRTHRFMILSNFPNRIASCSRSQILL